MDQVVEHLPNKPEALSSKSSINKTKTLSLLQSTSQSFVSIFQIYFKHEGLYPGQLHGKVRHNAIGTGALCTGLYYDRGGRAG
jgi:hypothetical protein